MAVRWTRLSVLVFFQTNAQKVAAALGVGAALRRVGSSKQGRGCWWSQTPISRLRCLPAASVDWTFFVWVKKSKLKAFIFAVVQFDASISEAVNFHGRVGISNVSVASFGQ